MQRKRAAIYCRVDVGGEPEMYQQVLSRQRSRLEVFAREHDIKITGYYEDAGYAGHDLARPGLQRMLTDWRAEKFDTVLVVKRTRLFRGSIWEEPKWPFPILSVNKLDRIPYHAQNR